MNLNMYTGRVTIARAGHNLNSLVIVISNCLEIRSNSKINMYVQYIRSIYIYTPYVVIYIYIYTPYVVSVYSCTTSHLFTNCSQVAP